jgi:hypothetical protein
MLLLCGLALFDDLCRCDMNLAAFMEALGEVGLETDEKEVLML